MPPVGRDVDARTGPGFYRLLPLKSQPGRSLHGQDPFGRLPVFPGALGQGVARGPLLPVSAGDTRSLLPLLPPAGPAPAVAMPRPSPGRSAFVWQVPPKL